MLAKLFKYDLKKEIKFFAIIYIAMIVCAGLGRFFAEISDTNFYYILSLIFQGTVWAGVANLFINNLLRLWAHFRRDVYGDEGYLLNSLPVDSSKIFWSKWLTAFTILLFNLVVSAGSVLLAYGDNISSFFNATKEILLIIGTLALEIYAIYGEGLLGIVITHYKTIKKRIFGAIYGFIAFIASQMLIFASVFIASIFNKDILATLTESTGYINFEIIKLVIIIGAICYALTIAITAVISAKLMNRGVNLE